MPRMRAFASISFSFVALSVFAGPLTSPPETMDVIDYGVSFADVLALSNVEPSQSVPYGTEALQTIVHFASNGESKADIVLIHGGCWSNAYSRDHLLPLASALADMGYSVWLPEYRRVGDAGGGWPGSFADVKAALAYVAGKTNGPLIAVGHSAGGHLALLAAQENNPHLDGVLALAPITELGRYSAQEGSCQAMVSEFLGGTLEDLPAIYRAASVNSDRVLVPAILLLGTEDPIVGSDQVADFPPKQVRLVSGASHFDLIHPKTAAFAVVLESLDVLSHVGEPR